MTVADQEQENICSAYLRHWNFNQRPDENLSATKEAGKYTAGRGN
jgi:hypothetical protein